MKRIISAICVLVALSAKAEVKLPSFFCDNMVLQQQTECNLWGTADANKTVSIITSWDGKTYKVKADANGKFEAKVRTPKAGGPYDITLSDGKKMVLRNILIGEVWICAGQSNMDMQLKGYKGQPVEGATEELLNCNDDDFRLLFVKRTAELTPQYDIKGGTWRVANAESVRSFSACAYYFGKALRKTLNVPVGLICTAYGGSACEAWMKADWLCAFPQVQQTITEADVSSRKQRCPTALYNGQLYPLIGYTLRGAIWYQGEDNIPRYSFYADLLKAMVEGWRSEWKQGDFPFYFCQIAPFDYSIIQWQGSQYLREQQLKAEEIISNSRMAVLMDAGLEYGIHPRKKRQAGERLALLALSNTYGVKGLPEFAKYKEVAFQNDTAVVSFDRSKEWVYFEHGTTSKNFEVAGSDRIFYPATKVWTSRNKVYVLCDQVKQPVAVRYAFKDWVEGDLMHDGLPVSSFRTDNWTDAPQTVHPSGKDYNNPQ